MKPPYQTKTNWKVAEEQHSMSASITAGTHWQWTWGHSNLYTEPSVNNVVNSRNKSDKLTLSVRYLVLYMIMWRTEWQLAVMLQQLHTTCFTLVHETGPFAVIKGSFWGEENTILIFMHTLIKTQILSCNISFLPVTSLVISFILHTGPLSIRDASLEHWSRNIVKEGFLCVANFWHAKQGQLVHPAITVSTGTQTQSTAAADGAFNNRPHRTKPGHYYSILCAHLWM